jgi:hypothetical protein
MLDDDILSHLRRKYFQGPVRDSWRRVKLCFVFTFCCNSYKTGLKYGAWKVVFEIHLQCIPLSADLPEGCRYSVSCFPVCFHKPLGIA